MADLTGPSGMYKKVVKSSQASCTVTFGGVDDSAWVFIDETLKGPSGTGGTQECNFGDLGVHVITITLTNEGGGPSNFSGSVLFAGDDNPITFECTEQQRYGGSGLTSQFIFAITVIP